MATAGCFRFNYVRLYFPLEINPPPQNTRLAYTETSTSTTQIHSWRGTVGRQTPQHCPFNLKWICYKKWGSLDFLSPACSLPGSDVALYDREGSGIIRRDPRYIHTGREEKREREISGNTSEYQDGFTSAVQDHPSCRSGCCCWKLLRRIAWWWWSRRCARIKPTRFLKAQSPLGHRQGFPTAAHPYIDPTLYTQEEIIYSRRSPGL